MRFCCRKLRGQGIQWLALWEFFSFFFEPSEPFASGQKSFFQNTFSKGNALFKKEAFILELGLPAKASR